MDIKESNKEKALIITPCGRIDSVTSKSFEDCVMAHVDNGDIQMAIVFKEVDFISSAGLRILLMLAKKIKSNRGHVVLCEMTSDVKEVFDVSGFSTIFTIKDSEKAALDFLAGH